MLDFQKLDPFWDLWSKPNPGISSKMLYPARLNHNLERKIGHEIFVKTEKTEQGTTFLKIYLNLAYSIDSKKVLTFENPTFNSRLISKTVFD